MHVCPEMYMDSMLMQRLKIKTSCTDFLKDQYKSNYLIVLGSLIRKMTQNLSLNRKK